MPRKISTAQAGWPFLPCRHCFSSSPPGRWDCANSTSRPRETRTLLRSKAFSWSSKANALIFWRGSYSKIGRSTTSRLSWAGPAAVEAARARQVAAHQCLRGEPRPAQARGVARLQRCRTPRGAREPEGVSRPRPALCLSRAARHVRRRNADRVALAAGELEKRLDARWGCSPPLAPRVQARRASRGRGPSDPGFARMRVPTGVLNRRSGSRPTARSHLKCRLGSA
jgi:hypothetical protein